MGNVGGVWKLMFLWKKIRFARAWIMSLAAALMISVEEASGMVILVGKQLSVS